jgi:pSer/pThr/pTyr-binding forkhead associated (FHA) protein
MIKEKTYVIGRKGHIQMAHKTTSALHAQLTIKDDSLYLTDLDSTNGTYIIEDGERLRFTEGYIKLHQLLSFGSNVCSVRELLARAEVASSDVA